MASAGQPRNVRRNRRNRVIWIVGSLVAFSTVFVYYEEHTARQLPDVLNFLNRYERISLSLERVPSGYGENLPSERSVESVYSISFENAVKSARLNVEQSSFREEPFPLPNWIVFRSNDGRFVGLIPNKQDRSSTTIVYVRSGTFLERCRDAIGL